MTAFNPNEDANTRIEQLLVALRTAEHTDTINISTVMIRIAGLLRQSKYVPTALLQNIIDVLHEPFAAQNACSYFQRGHLPICGHFCGYLM